MITSISPAVYKQRYAAKYQHFKASYGITMNLCHRLPSELLMVMVNLCLALYSTHFMLNLVLITEASARVRLFVIAKRFCFCDRETTTNLNILWMGFAYLPQPVILPAKPAMQGVLRERPAQQ